MKTTKKKNRVRSSADAKSEAIFQGALAVIAKHKALREAEANAPEYRHSRKLARARAAEMKASDPSRNGTFTLKPRAAAPSGVHLFVTHFDGFSKWRTSTGRHGSDPKLDVDALCTRFGVAPEAVEYRDMRSESTDSKPEVKAYGPVEEYKLISCGCCTGKTVEEQPGPGGWRKAEDQCVCFMHQDMRIGIRPKKCSKHKKGE